MKRKYRASLRNGASCEASQNCRSAFSLIGQPLRDRLPAQCVATTPVLVLVDLAAGKTFGEQVFCCAPLAGRGSGASVVADKQVDEEPEKREEQQPPDTHDPPPSAAHVVVAVTHLSEHQ